MKREIEVTETKKIIKRSCDFCGNDVDSTYDRIKSCIICGKDVWHCCGYDIDTDCDLSDKMPHSYSDYPDHICKTCWTIGRSLREGIQSIRETSEKAEEEIWEKWKEAMRGEKDEY